MRIKLPLIAFVILLMTTVISLKAQQWKPAGPDDFIQASYDRIYDPNIAFDSKGDPWILYSNSKITAKKLVNGVWVSQGKEGFSYSSYIGYVDMAFDKQDNLWVVYQDRGNADKAVAMKFANDTWTLQGGSAFTSDKADYTTIATDPNGIPWIVFEDFANNKKLTVVKFVNGSWVVQGGAGFTSGEASDCSLAFDSNGIPWVAFKDWTKVGKLTVMKLVNGTWTIQGTAGFSGGSANCMSLAFDSKGTPFVSFQDGANGVKISVRKFTGGNWTTEGNAGFSANQVGYTILKIDSNDSLWVCYLEGNIIKVMKLENGTWTPKGKTWYFGFGNSNGSVDMALDQQNNPWLVYGDEILGDKATVIKLDNNVWTMLGNGGFSEGGASHSDLAIDSAGNPWVVYRDYREVYKGTVRKYMNGQWQVQGSPGFTKREAWNNQIAMDNNGTPWIVFQDSLLQAMKFVNNTWVSQGSTYITPITNTRNMYLDMVMDGSNHPWVVFNDGNYADKATVMKLVNGTWSVQGNPGFSEAYSYYNHIAIDSGGIPWVAYSNNGGFRVMKLVNGTWTMQGNLVSLYGGALYMNIAFNKGAPYVLIDDYYNTTSHLQLMKLVNGTWTIQGKRDFASTIEHTDLTFDTLGNPWVLYNNWGATVMKLEKGTWKLQGKTGFSANNDPNNYRIAINAKGRAFVTYITGGMWAKEFRIPAPHQIEISGNKKEITNGDVTPSPLDSSDFGLVAMGSSRTVRFKIKNAGTDTLKLTGNPRVAISGTNASEFKVMTTLPAYLRVGDSVIFYVKHTPVSTGAKTAFIKIASNDPEDPVYNFGISASALSCNTTNPLANKSGYTYQASISQTDSTGWTCYCDAAGKLLLSIKIGNSGAVVLPQQVYLKTGPSSVFSSTNYGGLVTNQYGYAIINKRWNVAPSKQPTNGAIGIRYFFTAGEFSDLVTATAALTKPSTIKSVKDLNIYRTSTGGAFADPHTVSGALLTNGTNMSTTVWKDVKNGNDYFAEFQVSALSGGGIGCGGGGGAEARGMNKPLPEIDIQGNRVSVVNNDTLPSVADSTDMGTVPVGKTRLVKYTIMNQGKDTLKLTDVPLVWVGGINAAEFTVTAYPPSFIKAGDSGSFIVKHTPAKAGIRTAILSISNNDADEYLYNITIQSEAVTCTSGNAIANSPGMTYKGNLSATGTDGWTCFCDSTGKLLLSLKTGGTGAVITPAQVKLKLGNNMAFSSTLTGGMIGNADGYGIIDRRWDITPGAQPGTGNIGVRYYFTNPEFIALKSEVAGLPKPSTINAVTDLVVYKTISGAPFANPHTVNGIVLKNGVNADLSTWKSGLQGNYYFAEFFVNGLTGGGCGSGGGGGTGPAGFGAKVSVKALASGHTALAIFPQPASQSVTILLSTAEGMNTFELYNAMGTLVKTHYSASEETVLDIASLAGGIYMLRIRRPDGSVLTGKLIVE